MSGKFMLLTEFEDRFFAEQRDVVLRKLGRLTQLSLERSSSLPRLTQETQLNVDFLGNVLGSLIGDNMIFVKMIDGVAEVETDEDVEIFLTESGLRQISTTL